MTKLQQDTTALKEIAKLFNLSPDEVLDALDPSRVDELSPTAVIKLQQMVNLMVAEKMTRISSQ